MSEDKFHFEIPKENVRIESYPKRGFSPSVPRASHFDHGKNLQMQTQNLVKTEFNKKDAQYTQDLFLQIETPDEFKIKSQRFKIEELGFKILSFSPTNSSIGTAKIDKKELKKFKNKLDKYTNSKDHTLKSYFSPIEKISSIEPEQKIQDSINPKSNEEIEIIINLFNVIKPKELLAITNSISEELRQYSDLVEQRNFKNGVSSIYCRVPASKISEIASEFSTIKEIKTSQTFFVPQTTAVEKMPNPLKIEDVESDSIICIVDSGVKDNDIMSKLVKHRYNYLPANSVDAAYDHGTFVASRCVFGDGIDECLGTHNLKPYCNIMDVAVFGVDQFGNNLNPSEFSLRVAVEETVIKYKDIVKVYNLSLGSGQPISNNKYSDIAKLLDYLSKKYKVLFIIAAGNISNLLGNFPVDHFNNSMSRINMPAESLLGLTVGSIAKHISATSLSAIDCISPFSRKGPGADNGVKPELVAHGGNLINPFTKSPRTSAYGISKDGKNLSVDVGTSYSAPLIAKYAQKLFDTYPTSDPNLVKGLLCHFTEFRDNHKILTDSTDTYSGFGEPNIEKAIRAGNFNAAYIYEGQLDQDNYQYINFHIPKSLAADNLNTKLKVKITITYDPSVDPDNEIEYSETRISAALFKNTYKGKKTINVSNENKHNLPWNPIIKFESSFTRSYLAGQWALRLRLYTRGRVKDNYLQDFSVVIELIDELYNTDVYRDIEKEFSDIYKKISVIIAA
jgi:hypothetical protein